MIRRWLLPLLLAAFVWLLIAHRGEIRELLRTLASGNPRWVALAVLLQAACFVSWAGLYRRAFATAGVAGRLLDTLGTLMCAAFVNLVVPSAGAAGATLFVDDAARRGQSPARAAAGIVLCWASDLAALTTTLVLGAGYLRGRQEIETARLAAMAGLALVTGGMSAALFFGVWHPRWLGGPLEAMRSGAARLARRMKRESPLAPDWAAHVSGELAVVSGNLRSHPARVATLYGMALLMHAANMASLGALFFAFRQPIQPGALAAGYAFGQVAWTLSPVPQGIGVVEAVMALVYATLGVPATVATAIAISYRGLTFWLPMAVGFLLLRRTRSLRAPARTPEG
jgi:uncharacterized membrane protein YbhN (UPF0104 family)